LHSAKHGAGLFAGGAVLGHVVGEGLVELEGEGVTLADDGGGGGVLYAQEGGRYENRLTAAGNDPVVQASDRRAPGRLWPLGAVGD